MRKNINRKKICPLKVKLIHVLLYFGNQQNGAIYLIMFIACTLMLLHYINKADQWHNMPIILFKGILVVVFFRRAPAGFSHRQCYVIMWYRLENDGHKNEIIDHVKKIHYRYENTFCNLHPSIYCRYISWINSV